MRWLKKIIYVNLYFNIDNIDRVINSLRNLSPSIRPLYFGEEENKYSADNCLANDERFNGFKKNNEYGYLLFAEKCSYDVSFKKDNYAKIFVDLRISKNELDITHAREIIDCARRHGLIFGFAADCKEYFHRNQLSFSRAYGDVTTWVGRDLRKYLPGLYWLTAISNDIAFKLEITLENIPNYIQIYNVEGLSQCKLFQLYEIPWKWKKYKRQVDDLCEKEKGIFSIREVKKNIKIYRKHPELSKYLSNFR